MSVQDTRMPCDLSDLSCFAALPDASSRPSDALLRLSYELTVTAYDFDVERWHAAGWRDFSFRINEKLMTGTSVNGIKTGLTGSFKAGYYHLRARRKIHHASILAQYRGTRSGRDHAKAVFMLMPFGDRFVVGIGFTGTCRRIDDWLPNLLMDEKDGVHAGFLRLSKEIWKDSSRIFFPSCARRLGLEGLSLSDIIEECRRKDSRFLIWMSGHSQGGAVMQLFARYLSLKGVLAQNMVGCAFASPSVLWQPEECPVRLYLVMNSDDLIPRFGARFHYGHLWMEDMTLPDRMRCYAAYAEVPCLRALLSLSHQIRTSEDALLVTCALLEVLRDKDILKAPQFINTLLVYLKVDPVQRMEERLDSLTDRVRNRALRYYRSFTGADTLDPVRYSIVMTAIRDAMIRFGDGGFAQGVKEVLMYPHRIANSESDRLISPYFLICRKDGGRLRAVTDPELKIRPPW